jgi:hypothetical protein
MLNQWHNVELDSRSEKMGSNGQLMFIYCIPSQSYFLLGTLNMGKILSFVFDATHQIYNDLMMTINPMASNTNVQKRQHFPCCEE